MTVRKRGAHWHYDFQIEGVRYRAAIQNAKNKSDAVEEETKQRAKVLEGRFETRKKAPMFNEFAEIYSDWAKANKRSWKSDETHLIALKEFFGKFRLDRINRFSVEQFKRARLATETVRGDTRRGSTVNREIQTLSALFRLAEDAGHIKENPARRVKKCAEANERKRYLTTEEETKLFEILSDSRFDRVRPVVVVALQTGMRRGELLKLERRDLDFRRKLIHIRKEISKTGRERYVPMTETAFLILLEASEAKTKFVFGLKCIKRAWEKAIADAKINDFRFHDLRHTFASRLAEAGADAFTIAEILGHSDIRMTQRYTHASDERKKMFIEKLKPTVTKLSQSAEK